MILVTAATQWEANPLIKHWKLKQSASQTFRGRCGTKDVVLLRTGVGPSKASWALDQLPDIGFDASGIAISSGFAGALQPGVRSGEIVADMREAPIELVQAARKVAEDRRIALHFGAVQSSDRVLAGPEEKKDLGKRSRAVAVDMESATVHDWCRKKGGTSLVVRSVLDSVDDRLPEAPPKDGDLSLPEWAEYVAKEWRNIPLLLTLGMKQRIAMSTLVRFLDGFAAEI